MNKLWIALTLVGTVFIGACTSLDSAQKEKIKVYEEQKKREEIDRSQRESNASGSRLDKAIRN